MPSYLVDLPDKFVFSTTLPVVYSDLNPGRHLAAEKALPLVLETQLRFCRHLGYQDPPDKEFGV